MVRIVETRDAAEICEIFVSYAQFSAISFATELPTVEDFHAKIGEISATLPWLVYELDGQVKGYAYASPHRSLGAYRWCVEVSIYVAAEFRGAGIGKSLYRELFRILRELGYYNAYAGITLPNGPSVRLHQFFGFEKFCVFESIGHKLGQWHDVAWYKLALQDNYAANPLEPKSIKYKAEPIPRWRE